MRAYGSACCEIEIELTDQEISDLEKKMLRGRIKLRHKDEMHERCIGISIGKLEKNLYLDLKVFPQGRGYPHIVLYSVILSEEGYQRLKTKGMTVERVGGPGKITVHKKNHNRPWV